MKRSKPKGSAPKRDSKPTETQLKRVQALWAAYDQEPPKLATKEAASIEISRLQRKLETAKRMGGAAALGIRGPLV